MLSHAHVEGIVSKFWILPEINQSSIECKPKLYGSKDFR